jgi:hypothetical protein
LGYTTRRGGTGQPVFGPFPAGLEGRQGLAHGLAADAPWRDPFGSSHLGSKVEGPATARCAKGARALVEQRLALLAPGWSEHGVRRLRRRGRLALQRRQAPPMERLEGVAHGLIVAAQRRGDEAGVLPTGTGHKDRAAAQDKGIGRP